jgi:hypothetical protein
MTDGPERKPQDAEARAADGGAVMTLRCGEALVEVDAGDADAARWLREFVTRASCRARS